MMQEFRCNNLFCKWNKKFGICTHPDSEQAIKDEIPNPVEGCENMEITIIFGLLDAVTAPFRRFIKSRKRRMK